jgi:uncharacterized protein
MSGKTPEKIPEKGADKAPDPRRTDLRTLARHRGLLQGTVAPAALPRLALSVESAGPAAWSARGELREVKGGEPQVWLHLRAEAGVRLVCQRCLQTLEEPLEVDRHFLFLPDEDEVARLDEELDDDVLVLPRFFDLLELVEDELILALPIVPRHTVCPEPLPVPDDPVELDADAAAPHPFAALAALKKPPRPN